MKKLFFLASVAMAAIASVFVSCENNDDFSEDTAQEAHVVIDYTVSSDLLSFADVKFTVTDFNGKTHNVVVNQAGKQKLDYSTTKRNGTVQATFEVQPKADFKPVDGKSYNLEVICSATKKITDKDGGASQCLSDAQIFPEATLSGAVTLSKEGMLEKYQSRYTIKCNATYTLTNGRFVK